MTGGSMSSRLSRDPIKDFYPTSFLNWFFTNQIFKRTKNYLTSERLFANIRDMLQERLTLIKRFYRKFHRLPSYSEMLSIFKVSSKNSVFKIINKLIDAGYLKRINKKIIPTNKFFALPLLGEVKAGYPILAEENRQYLSLDEYLIENPAFSFLLKVSGDSLMDLGIFDGDIVIIERKKDVIPGDIVLAQIDREWTLKILRKDRVKNRFYLEAANKKYPPLFPRQELQIFGRVKAVIRKIN